MLEQESLLGVAVLFLSVLLLFFFLLGRYRKREIQRLQSLLQGRISKDEAQELLEENMALKNFRNISNKTKEELRVLRASSKEELRVLRASSKEELKKMNEKFLALQTSSKEELKKREEEIATLTGEISVLKKQFSEHEANLRKFCESNLTSIPWLAGMMADFLTYDIEMKAKYLDWGSDQRRLKKVESIRDIRFDAENRIQQAKEAIYQLEYLKTLYPALEDVLSTDYKDLNFTGQIPEHDPARDYLSAEEWARLSDDEKNQLALDRYIESRNKSKWQIGRDYELSVAYEYLQKGYTVDTYGSRKGLEDLGRDLIAQKAERVLIIQCKYWSQKKTIHEKHLFQLYGTVVLYKIDHPDLLQTVHAVFVTNTSLSKTAHEVANVLGITVVESHKMVEFPRIKCNIGRDELGYSTRIYHLPMDAQYDIVQIKNPGEFYAFTVEEATSAGFRRAYKWHGN